MEVRSKTEIMDRIAQTIVSPGLTLVAGCGPRHIKQPGEVLCDIRRFPNVEMVHDLNQVPWPWPDNHFIHVSAVHVVEHLDSLIAFMDEAHRVLKPGGSLYLETPLAGVNPDLTHADPTHVRCYRIHSFCNYFSPEGVDRFGYTDRSWNFFVLRVQNDCIVVHAYPLKQS